MGARSSRRLRGGSSRSTTSGIARSWRRATTPRGGCSRPDPLERRGGSVPRRWPGERRADGDEAQSGDDHEEPVENRNVNGEILHVVQVQDLMIDESLDQIEE